MHVAIALCVFLVLFSSALAIAPLHLKTKEPILNSYLVVFLDSVSSEQLAADLSFFQQAHNITYEHTYEWTIKGFAASLDKSQLLRVRSNPRVAYVEQNQVMRMNQMCTSEDDVPSWGLSRISLEGWPKADDYAYRYDQSTNGAGVTVYVIDTGIRITHNDFKGSDGKSRASWGFSANSQWSKTDDHGHGTHVASTVAGTLYGVAKQANVVAVRVLGPDGSGTTAGVIAGVEYTYKNSRERANAAAMRSVNNLSLGGGYSSALNAACNAASSNGVPTVVASGNDDDDACNGSPASASKVLSVGATDQGTGPVEGPVDARSYFSNYGTCVHVFAPGSDITGAWMTSDSSKATISGTSMASPHVAGQAAVLMSQKDYDTFEALKQDILNFANKDLIDFKGSCSNSDCSTKSPNLLLFNGCPSS